MSIRTALSVLPALAALPALPGRLRQTLQLGLLRAGFRLQFRLKPEAAAHRAAALFLTPRRRPQASRAMPKSPALPLALPGTWLFAPHGGATPRGRILVVHGWEDDHLGMSPLIDRLNAAGFEVATLDLPGHGRRGRGIATVPMMASAVAALGESAGPFDGAVAHSLGGVATMLALTRMGLRAERVALLASPNHPEHFARGVAGLLGLDEAQFRLMRNAIEARVGQTMDQLYLPALLSGRSLPGLILHDPADRVVPFRHSEETSAAWCGAWLTAIPGTGHRRIVSDGITAAMLLEFFGAPSDRPTGDARQHHAA